MSNTIALATYLKPFMPYFAMEGVNEICINRPYEVWVETQREFKRFDEPSLSIDFLLQFASLVGEYNQREISPECPTLSSVLPDGARVQFVIEPACAKGTFVCAIRRQATKEVSLHHYFKEERTEEQTLNEEGQLSQNDRSLLTTYEKGYYALFLKQAVLARKNIVIAGGTSTGKTTFLNALLQEVPLGERIITLETDREVMSSHLNSVHLLATEEGKSVSNITMLDLLKASLRLRPDRLLVSEIRAEEAFSYLRAINSGHPGSITTLHADSPEGCFEQLAWMALQSGCPLSRQEIIQYAKSIINVIVQIKRGTEGKRFISAIYFDKAAECGLKDQESLVTFDY
ncbi:MAG: type secretion system ATPase VirB11 [Gammaproteobacteria bacterium]|jgi:type IV secretion system protein VirB11|nr:type secretion system ATPase VirB11 [Gammaproteobacteria bacterium]